MATSLLQVRVDDTLKSDAAQVFEQLGIDTSIAVRMFLKRVVLENGIPFRMVLPKEAYRAEDGYNALTEISKESARKGLADMSLKEINAEISAYRNGR